MRDVAERIDWLLAHKPKAAGRCAEHVMNALNLERQGFANATQMADVVLKAGRMETGPCPKGAIRYWTGGSKGYGHVAIEAADLLDPAAVASVDVKGPGTVGVVSLAWITNTWGGGSKGLRYRGWSWWFGRVNTDPAKIAPPPPKPEGNTVTGSKVTQWRDYSGKPKTMQVVAADNKWHRLVGIDVAAPPISGTEQHMLYARLGFLWRQDGDGMAVCECKWVRDGGTPGKPDDDDPTAYKELHFERGTRNVPSTSSTWRRARPASVARGS